MLDGRMIGVHCITGPLLKSAGRARLYRQSLNRVANGNRGSTQRGLSPTLDVDHQAGPSWTEGSPFEELRCGSHGRTLCWFRSQGEILLRPSSLPLHWHLRGLWCWGSTGHTLRNVASLVTHSEMRSAQGCLARRLLLP